MPATAVSPDGSRGLSGSWDGTVRLWDLKTGKSLRRLAVGGRCEAVAFSRSARRASSTAAGPAASSIPRYVSSSWATGARSSRHDRLEISPSVGPW